MFEDGVVELSNFPLFLSLPAAGGSAKLLQKKKKTDEGTDTAEFLVQGPLLVQTGDMQPRLSPIWMRSKQRHISKCFHDFAELFKPFFHITVSHAAPQEGVRSRPNREL